MHRLHPGKLVVIIVLVFLAIPRFVCGQTQQTPPKPSKEEVVRVFTELVQTDVMVFDKQGRFVDGLGKESFELRIDGKVKPIQSFEQITEGSDEEAQLAAARGTSSTGPHKTVPFDRGRTVFFYIDDFHMDLQGLVATRKVVTHFIETDMGQNDQVAISSASGQIGFLQQLTDNRMVLRSALERLSPRNYSARDFDRPPMSEYQAMLIDRGDIDVTDVFVTETLRNNPGMDRQTAASIVKGRSQAIVSQGLQFTNNTLRGLETLVRRAKGLPGRKIVFLLTDGFFIENNRSDTLDRIRQITSAAAKSGAVIYSFDTRGLISGLPDASSDIVFDPSGRLQTSALGELSASQDGLHALAVDTGGKAILNTNDLTKGVAPALKDSSNYYLLAWKPDSEGQKPGRFRKIEVVIPGRSDLVVRVRRGFFDVDPSATADAKPPDKNSDSKNPVVESLRKAILSPYPVTDIPLTLGLNYYDVVGKGATVSTSVVVPGEFLTFGDRDGKIQAIVDVTGVFYTDKGQPVTNFLERIVTTAASLEVSKTFDNEIYYSFPAKVEPGLYQVRVAARDDKTGKVGTANAWIQVPDITTKKLITSSLLLGESRNTTVTNVGSTPTPVNLSANHRFHSDSLLRFLIVTYNATPSPTDQKPDIAVQVQLLRDDQPVITTTLRKVGLDGVADLTHVPYAAEMSLADLKPGRYVLQVSVIDKVAKQSASQKTRVDIY